LIVGRGTNPAGDSEGWYAVIPEPSSGMLLGFGLLSLIATTRRAQV